MSKQPIVYITRRATFSAAHRLYRDEYSREKNLAIYSKCATPFGHGHNYELEVTLRGPVDPTTGMVMNLTALKDLMDQEVIEKLDHHNLNQDCEMFTGVNPTAEHLVRVIWNVLEPKIPRGLLYEIKCRETENNQSIYRGESQ